MVIVFSLLLFKNTLSPIVLSGGALSPFFLKTQFLASPKIYFSEFASMRVLRDFGKFVLLFDLFRLNSLPDGRFSGGIGAFEFFLPFHVGNFSLLAGGGALLLSDAIIFSILPFENLVSGKALPLPLLSGRVFLLKRFYNYPFSLFSGVGFRTLTGWGKNSGIVPLVFAELGISFDLSLERFFALLSENDEKVDYQKLAKEQEAEAGKKGTEKEKRAVRKVSQPQKRLASIQKKIKVTSHTFEGSSSYVKVEGEKVFLKVFEVSFDGGSVIFSERTRKALLELAYFLDLKGVKLFILVRGKGFRSEVEKEAFLKTARSLVKAMTDYINSVVGKRLVGANYIVADDPDLKAPKFTMFVELRIFR